MSDLDQTAGPTELSGPAPQPTPTPERRIDEELRLRPPRPGVTRISRKVLIAAGAVSATAIAGATVFALHGGARRAAPAQDLYSTENRTTAEGLAGLPRDYAGVPRNAPPLGPPLPGDLGRPIVAAQDQDKAVPVAGAQATPASGPTTVDPQLQRLADERTAARESKLFAGTSMQDTTASGAPSPALAGVETTALSTPSLSAARPGAAEDAGGRQNQQDSKLGFLNAATDKRTDSPDRLQPPASPYVVQAGAVISGALMTGIRSDLPGQITGQVTENVYDTPTGRYLLIPQGSKLIGVYDSQIAAGQSRVLLVWTRLTLPDGKSIVLERQPGADGQGFAGLQDQVDDHWGALLKGALLSTLLSVGAEAGTSNNENNLAQAIRQGASDSFSQTGNQIVRQQLNIQPTLTIRPGYPVMVIVNRDLVLAPYGA